MVTSVQGNETKTPELLARYCDALLKKRYCLFVSLFIKILKVLLIFVVDYLYWFELEIPHFKF